MKRKAIICVLMALLAVCLLSPAMASEEVKVKNVTITPNDTAANTTIIYYGGHDWYVIENVTDSLTLFSKNLIYGERYRYFPSTTDNWLSTSDNGTSYTGMRYGETDSGTKFTGSKMEKALKAVLDMDFSGSEQAAITTENWRESGKSVSALIWPLDYDKWGSPDIGATNTKGKLNQSLRRSYAGNNRGDHWWFRTPSADSMIWFADGGGDFYGWGAPQGGTQGNKKTGYYGMRPAFYLNLEKVLFFSDAVGGKTTGAVSSDLASHTTTSNKYKVTIEDDTRSDFSASLTSIENNTSVNLDYSNAKYGENEFLSAIIKNANDDVVYYGRIKALTSAEDANGTAKVNIPNGITLDGGTKLYVFNEHYNQITNTTVNGYNVQCVADYASRLIEIDIYLFQVIANGSDTERTTQLTLTLSPDVAGLSADDITVTGATKGTLAKVSGETGKYTLAISDITVGNGENVNVAVSISGYTIIPVTVNRDVAVYLPTECAFTKLEANGSDTVKTTMLTLTFDMDVAGLSADDITVTGATKGTLTKVEGETGKYTLAISDITVGNGENVNVAVSRSGYTIAPANRNATVYLPTECAFTNLEANGSDTVKTTMLTLTFDMDVAGLSADDITVTGATKGTLTKVAGETGKYTLAISDITVGNGENVNVAVSKSGYGIIPANRDVAVYLPTECAFTNLEANGSDTVKTTMLTLTFDMDVAGLSADDITVTGATKGTLTKVAGETGKYALAISDITVGNGENVNVAVSRSGYTIAPANRNATVYLPTECAFTNLEANGSVTESTTLITLTFDRDVVGLSADDITVTGATKGTLTKVEGETGKYTLAISDITVGDGGTVNVAVSKGGYTITPANRAVTVRLFTPNIPRTGDERPIEETALLLLLSLFAITLVLYTARCRRKS